MKAASEQAEAGPPADHRPQPRPRTPLFPPLARTQQFGLRPIQRREMMAAAGRRRRSERSLPGSFGCSIQPEHQEYYQNPAVRGFYDHFQRHLPKMVGSDPSRTYFRTWTSKQRRVAPRELLEPGSAFMLTHPPAELVYIEGRRGRGLWCCRVCLDASGRRRSGRRLANLAPWRRASRVAYRRQKRTRRRVKRASHAVDKSMQDRRSVRSCPATKLSPTPRRRAHHRRPCQ
jgi:hypothetical protein